MDVIVELSHENSQQFEARGNIASNSAARTTPMIDQLTTTIDELSVIIRPQFRSADDPAESYFFVIETKDWEECQRIASVLDQLPAVEAAYCKPEAEPASLP